MPTSFPLVQVDLMMQSDPARARLPHDDRYSKGSAFVNGEYCGKYEAAVPLVDQGFTQGDATYEKITVAKGRYFRLQDHFDRFSRSCEQLRLRCPYSNREMVEIFDTLIRLTGLKDAGVWWCVTRGLSKGVGDRSNPAAFQNRFYAYTDPYASLPNPGQRARGLALMVSEKYIRIPPRAVNPAVKNFHWLDMKLALFEARDHGREWAVLTDAEGYLTEASGANIFVIKDGELYTPDSGCLEGITRKSALELAETIGIRTHVEKVHARQLKEADDAFLSTTAGGIVPVNSVDGIVLGGVEGPGELSARLHNLYWEKMWDGWNGTPVNY